MYVLEATDRLPDETYLWNHLISWRGGGQFLLFDNFLQVHGGVMLWIGWLGVERKDDYRKVETSHLSLQQLFQR